MSKRIRVMEKRIENIEYNVREILTTLSTMKVKLDILCNNYHHGGIEMIPEEFIQCTDCRQWFTCKMSSKIGTCPDCTRKWVESK